MTAPPNDDRFTSVHALWAGTLALIVFFGDYLDRYVPDLFILLFFLAIPILCLVAVVWW
ncbi:MAG: hypothetical protein IT537_31375 [Hyphomicrobiales bacterium]|nr:hypothetical protein [Hyphomicrobiales bacterium]